MSISILTNIPGRAATLAVTLAAAGFLVACGGDSSGGAAASAELSGTVVLDGSSTVFPVAEAMAEEFGLANPGVRVPVGLSGSGGGFKKFCAGETDISNASRPIKDSELETCRSIGIEPIEFRISWDGLTVVKNPANDWAQCMTVEELSRIWQPGSTITRWSQVRDGWPDEEIKLYGPDTDSGTFDYFTEAINGEDGASRDDYTASADDNVLVVGVAGDAGALGYFGFAYYEENTDRLGDVAVDNGNGCIAPTRETVENGTYAPLSRPMFIYTKKQALAKPVVGAFIRFWMENSKEIVPEVGYVPMADSVYADNIARLEELTGGGAGAMEDGDATDAAE